MTNKATVSFNDEVVVIVGRNKSVGYIEKNYKDDRTLTQRKADKIRFKRYKIDPCENTIGKVLVKKLEEITLDQKEVIKNSIL